MFKRLPASSLVEVTVAAAILVIVFGLALAVCARLLRQGPGPQQLLAQQLVQHRVARTVRSRQWLTRAEEVGPITIEQTVSLFHAIPGLYHLHVQALLQDSVLAQHQQLIYAPLADAP